MWRGVKWIIDGLCFFYLFSFIFFIDIAILLRLKQNEKISIYFNVIVELRAIWKWESVSDVHSINIFTHVIFSIRYQKSGNWILSTYWGGSNPSTHTCVQKSFNGIESHIIIIIRFFISLSCQFPNHEMTKSKFYVYKLNINTHTHPFFSPSTHYITPFYHLNSNRFVEWIHGASVCSHKAFTGEW